MIHIESVNLEGLFTSWDDTAAVEVCCHREVWAIHAFTPSVGIGRNGDTVVRINKGELYLELSCS